ncbi:MAG: PAS domain S-box protein [Proteobacteria bacterium]|nr:PAS domain S-box protein [Pseudomonadota bacterium]
MVSDIKNIPVSFEELERLYGKIRSLEKEIHDLRAINAGLVESEKRYRTIFETTGTATIIIEDDKTISMMNTEFENLSGFTKQEIEGKRIWTDFIDDIDLEMMKTYHEKRRDTPEHVPRNYVCRLRNKWRDNKTAMMTVALIPGTRQSVASVRDITERRRAEEALKYSEEKFSKAFRASPQAMMISTFVKGHVVDVNHTYLDMMGYEKVEVVGMNASDFHPYTGVLGYADIVKDITASGRIKNRDVTLQTAQGTVRYGYMSAEIIDIQGIPCLLTSINDITEQRRLEADILRISEGERRKIGHDLHDDLGQHLVGIEALAILLKQRLDAEMHSETHCASEIVSLIRDATKKTRNLAKGLCPVDMDEGGLVSSLTEFAVHVEKVFGVVCRFYCLISLKITNNAVATNLYRIAQEAVNNALRHGRAKTIKISLVPVGDSVCLVVSDKGCGIRDSGRSQGLGLSIMGYRAKSIRADLTINITKEKGTRVICRINREYLL